MIICDLLRKTETKMATIETKIKLTKCVLDYDLLKGDVVVVYNLETNTYSDPMNYLGKCKTKSVEKGWPMFGRDDWSNSLNPIHYLFYVQ